tara:strand:+ start:34 stop:804 length:771 start_codon:yes stop_codon:yes gene_type:complete
MVNENKNIKQLIHIFKTVNSIFIFIFIIMIQKQVNANDFLTIENISIDIVYEDISLARNKANNKAIFIGLDRLLSWRLSNNDYILIKNILNDINNVPNLKDFVAGYKIHYEKISDIKYQAEFSIYFNINKIKNWLSSHNIGFYENLNSKIIYLNADFDSFKNWRLLIDNIESIKEILDLTILSLTYKSSLIYVSIDVINETSLFNIFNKSRIDIQKRINTNNEYNISLIDYNKTIIDSFETNDKNIKKDSSILLTE